MSRIRRLTGTHRPSPSPESLMSQGWAGRKEACQWARILRPPSEAG